MSDFQKLAQLAHSKNDLEILFAAIGLRRLLSLAKDPPN
jgi:importin subunit alpha-6/7